ncbi:MAG: helix-turn-helix domain-containing protein [Candidatus Komeilibacteria bacterium]|jgi:cytoskeletal protein RodZ|nr:helix-turn-helix domain-containing protein [Candidatus Komeilibacteria bacterium]MBT4447448.1 helix-turn-helix domain-containing protein [Candidatus Komeilibacteria bacterium]
MSSFRQKKITRSQNLADKLRQARLAKEISLEEVAEATKIQVKYLEILEEGDYQKLPGDIYSKAWLKLYGDFLGLQVNELLVDYKIEKSISNKLTKVSSPVVKSNNISLYSILKPRVLKFLGIALLILALLAYLGWEINNTISPPEVTIFEPSNNFKTTESSVNIKGQTKAEVQLTINNELVLLDEEGKFNQSINLINGLNNLEISAKKKHSKVKTIEIIILRESLE